MITLIRWFMLQQKKVKVQLTLYSSIEKLLNDEEMMKLVVNNIENIIAKNMILGNDTNEK